MDLELLHEINRKLDKLLQMCAKKEERQPTKGLRLSDEELKRIYKSVDKRATSLSDLSEEDQALVTRYLSGVEKLGLDDAQREVLVDVLVASREAVGKWPRISKLKERLIKEVMDRTYEAESAWLDDAYGWAGQD